MCIENLPMLLKQWHFILSWLPLVVAIILFGVLDENQKVCFIFILWNVKCIYTPV